MQHPASHIYAQNHNVQVRQGSTARARPYLERPLEILLCVADKEPNHLLIFQVVVATHFLLATAR